MKARNENGTIGTIRTQVKAIIDNYVTANY